ncbi:hypothetical protein V1520DRAFT_340411 [Lipomyces starkeyi]|uniref:Uncharacterized protein n=1 Tax=Lipomyces starkeyi NRRL Y-11557 TaxID=675824 RepID=A0A1E3QAC9_LIPST|nr:hypothetical protein LIPSTDRAFT_81294 [Lipomyces starkeyi NRRL Y-11557]
MGISGLLPLLKSIQQPAHVKEFAGQVIAVDAYVWLHRGAIACATDLAFGNHTRKYVDYAMHRVRMLKYYGVKPYLVFDGANLPSKQHTEKDRQISREAAREAAMKLHKAGMRREADEHFQKCIDITPTMASHLIKALEKEGIPYIVAPYEADAQMVYLEKKRLVSAVISEDSDLLVFGCKCLLTKLNDYGECVVIRRERFSSSTEIDLTSFSDALFRHMAIFAGCDYTPGIPNIGLRKAHMYLRRYKSADRALKFMRLEGKITVPPGFIADFERADKTFQYQRVFCPIQQKVVMWNEPADPLPEQLDYNIGKDIEPAIALAVATGKLDPNTKELIPDDARIGNLGERVNGTAFKPIPQEGQTITDFFKVSRDKERRPLSDITNSASSATPHPTIAPNSTQSSAFALGRRGSPPFTKPTPEDPITKRLRVLSPSISDSDGMDNSVIVHSRFFSAVAQASDFPGSLSPKNYQTPEEDVNVGKDIRVVGIPAEDLKSGAEPLGHRRVLGSDEQVNQPKDVDTEGSITEYSQKVTQQDPDELAAATQTTKYLRSHSSSMMTPPSTGLKLRNSDLLPSSFFAPRRQQILTPPDSTTKAATLSSSTSSSFSTASTGSSSSSCAGLSSALSPLLDKSRFLHFRAPKTSEDASKHPSTPIQRSIHSFASASYSGTPTHARRPVINSNGIGVIYHGKPRSRPALSSMPTTLDNSQLKGRTSTFSSTQIPNSVQTRLGQKTVNAAEFALAKDNYETSLEQLAGRDMTVSTHHDTDRHNQTVTSFQASLWRFRNEN